MRKVDLIVCGGGTGGHFFSGLALAEDYLKFCPEAKILFVGTKNGIEARHTLTDSRMSVKFIAAKGVKGKGLSAKILALLYMIYGFFQSLKLLFEYRPKLVFGVGGYASVPTVFAAIVSQIFGGWKVGILEQNSSAGLANFIFSKLTKRAYAAFPCDGFQLVDLPLRTEFMTKAGQARSPQWPPKTIFILGGSQGATGLNQRWIQILPELKKLGRDFRFIHQTGIKDAEAVKQAYQKLNFQAEVFSFSNEMPKYYDAADLMICRSGAMTVFEVMAFKRPCIFVPYPSATDDHQTKNALSVQDSQWVIAEKDFDWEHLEKLLNAPEGSIPHRRQLKEAVIHLSATLFPAV
jgi:UDP-N-acetylglucosamine--N-acetylmuramyl-(pentapeptide) pyrophosphoryl-undecaprenol N-acetylglucosamine transferase